MRFGINLRGDLALLDLHEIERAFDRLLIERRLLFSDISETFTVGNKWLYQNGYGMPFGRGLLHAKIFYAIRAVVYGGSHRKGLGRLYMIDCELKDLMDECRRRR